MSGTIGQITTKSTTKSANTLGRLPHYDSGPEPHLGDYPQADVGSSSPAEMGVRNFPAHNSQDYRQNGVEEAGACDLCGNGDASPMCQAEGKKTTHQRCWHVDERACQVITEPHQLLACMLAQEKSAKQTPNLRYTMHGCLPMRQPFMLSTHCYPRIWSCRA